ncbi:hypothetical protein U1Q18_001943 [Sarracenia purpurea var. burkii]
MFWLGRIVSVGREKLDHLPYTRFPSSPMMSWVELEFPTGFVDDGHKFWPEEELSPLRRRRSPEDVITREPETVMGESWLADQTTVVAEMLGYQTEKMKRFEELGRGRNPAAKMEFGESRIWLWFGRHGEFEKEKDEMLLSFWADNGDGFERRKVKKTRGKG